MNDQIWRVLKENVLLVTQNIEQLQQRAADADKRMQFLQDAIDTRTHWLDAAKERIQTLEKKVADLVERLDGSSAAHADEFKRLEERLGWLEKKTGLTEETP